MPDFFQTEIRNKGRYRQQIRKLFVKLRDRQALFHTQQAGVNFFSFGLHEAKLAKILRKAIVNETYQLQPAKQRTIVVNNKKRVIYDFVQLDKIVISMLMSILVDMAESYLSNQLFSYRKGRRPLDAIKCLAGYLKKQRQRVTQPKDYDCYLLKTDIADYTDHIYTAGDSKLWRILDAMFLQAGCKLTAYQRSLIQSCFRPSYYNAEGLLQCNIRGVPTGSAASTLVYNLYLAEIDQHMAQFNGLYYARYSDDILLAHADFTELQKAIAHFNVMLLELGLQRKQRKDLAVYFTPTGKAAPEASWQGANKLTYLGYDVYADGAFLLSAKRQQKFLSAIRQRIFNVLQLLQSQEEFAERGKTLCCAVNTALLDDTFGENATEHLLECTHLAMLKHLDYLIALMIAEGLTQRRGVKAFRQVPYHKIRADWGLISLVKWRTSLYSHCRVCSMNCVNSRHMI